jgi:hypothetical protein
MINGERCVLTERPIVRRANPAGSLGDLAEAADEIYLLSILDPIIHQDGAALKAQFGFRT